MRRFSANYVYTNAGAPIRNGVVSLNSDGVIAEIIDHKGKEKEYAHTEFRNGIIVPGFVNAHCHLELSHLKGKFDTHKGLAHFVNQIREYRLQSNEIDPKSIQIAIEDISRDGTVAVADICNTTHSFEAKQKADFKVINLIEVLGLSAEHAQGIISRALATKELANDLLEGPNFLTPHSVYSLSEELLKLLYKEMQSNDIVSIHFAESPDEALFTEHRKGGIAINYTNWELNCNDAPKGNPLEIVKNYLPKKARVLFIHNTYLTNNDANELATHFSNAYFVLCPASNLQLQNSLPNIPMLYKTGVPIALGTDSLASSATVSVFEQIKIISNSFPEIPFQNIVEWATINGAKALGLEQTIGSIELGKAPGLNLIAPFDFKNNRLLPNSRVIKLA